MKPSKRNLSDSKFKNRNSQSVHIKTVYEKTKSDFKSELGSKGVVHK